MKKPAIKKVSPILLAANSKTGIFGIFPKEQPNFVTFKTGILRAIGPVIKVTTKVRLHDVNQLGLPRAALGPI